MLDRPIGTFTNHQPKTGLHIPTHTHVHKYMLLWTCVYERPCSLYFFIEIFANVHFSDIRYRPHAIDQTDPEPKQQINETEKKIRTFFARNLRIR